MKQIIGILAAFFLFLSVDAITQEVENRLGSVTDNTTYSITQQSQSREQDTIHSLNAIPTSNPLLQTSRHQTRTDNTEQRDLKYAMGAIIKEFSYYKSITSVHLETINNGKICSYTKYSDKYYIFATRHILI